ncbi:unnamed protein product [Toxocara canis]|uniref:RNase H domain-containing protein n=1 Tax=Toxocara canis TaxID=6265 RepID=A0A183UYK1_TOXCA|nr:unnamed protein product [Toxocara canis]
MKQKKKLKFAQLVLLERKVDGGRVQWMKQQHKSLALKSLRAPSGKTLQGFAGRFYSVGEEFDKNLAISPQNLTVNIAHRHLVLRVLSTSTRAHNLETCISSTTTWSYLCDRSLLTTTKIIKLIIGNAIDLDGIETAYVKTSRGSVITIVFIKNRNDVLNHRTKDVVCVFSPTFLVTNIFEQVVLFSQPNGSDLGCCLQPEGLNLSIGTAPTIAEAAQHLSNLCGMVLIALFNSDWRLLFRRDPAAKTCFLDRFLTISPCQYFSYERAPEVDVPSV